MKPETLPVPDGMPDGTQEIARIFAPTKDQSIFAIATPDFIADPAYWGAVAANLMRHAAQMLEGRLARSDGAVPTRSEILERIRMGFDRAWEKPGEVQEIHPKGIGDA